MEFKSILLNDSNSDIAMNPNKKEYPDFIIKNPFTGKTIIYTFEFQVKKASRIQKIIERVLS